jgi:hypothetical protein
MSYNPAALDRYITGNYGEDQFPPERDFCLGPHDLTYLGEDDGHKVYACRFCGDLYDRRYCKREMQTGNCVLDLNHRGRCTTVGFYCDSCGRMRRGQPHVHATQLMSDGYREPVADICFMCSRGLS